jgi:hypothetical protein
VPEQSVSSSYLSTLAQTCARAYPSSPRSALLAKATSILVSSLPQKRAEPKATAFEALLQYIQQSRNSLPPLPDAEWAPDANPRIRPLVSRNGSRPSILAQFLCGDDPFSGIGSLTRIGPRRMEARRLLRGSTIRPPLAIWHRSGESAGSH